MHKLFITSIFAIYLIACSGKEEDSNHIENNNQGGTNQGGTNQGGTNQGGTNQGGTNQGGLGGNTTAGAGTGGVVQGGTTQSGTGGTTAGAGGVPQGGAGGSSAGTGGAPLDCAVHPAPSGPVTHVTPADAPNLHSIVYNAPAGTTFLLADGTYNIASTLQFAKPQMRLRSASNDASHVIIDGTYTVNELIAVSANDVSIEDVTLTHAIDHAIHAYPSKENVDITGISVYRVRLIDHGEQFIKINPNGSNPGYIDYGSVECSEFVMTDAGRPHVESCCGGCYTGGIDAHAARGWIVAKNRFDGIYCTNGGLAEHAIHFWKGSRDTLVENNTIIDCARGIGFGLGGGTGDRVYADKPYDGANLAHYDGIIRNNIIWANVPAYDTGIEINVAKQPRVLHNTVLHGSNATNVFSSIDYRFPETTAIIQNNLTDRITQRDGASGTVDHNLEKTPLSFFVNIPTDFHLVSSATNAIDKGIITAESGLDIDGQAHNIGAPDLGADER